MTDRQRLLDRIEKLLALSRSSNPHEAKSAREKAERLMKENGITPEEIERNEQGLYEVSLGWKGFSATWKFSLATAAARYHGCEAVGLKRHRKTYVRLVGEVQKTVHQAEALFLDLMAVVSKLERMAASEVDPGQIALDELNGISPRQAVDSFRRGVAAGLIIKLATTRPSRFGRRAPSSSRSSPTSPSPSPPSSPPPPSSSPDPTLSSSSSRVWWKPSTWFGRDNPQLEISTTTALVLSSSSDKHEKTNQSDRVSSKYRPSTKPLGLDDVVSEEWYEYGRLLVLRNYDVVDGGDEEEKADSQGTDNGKNVD